MVASSALSLGSSVGCASCRQLHADIKVILLFQCYASKKRIFFLNLCFNSFLIVEQWMQKRKKKKREKKIFAVICANFLLVCILCRAKKKKCSFLFFFHQLLFRSNLITERRDKFSFVYSLLFPYQWIAESDVIISMILCC